MTIVELTVTDQVQYKTTFTSGLVQHRDCFRISPADEAREPFPTTGQPDSFTLGLLTETNELAGVVSFEREGRNREKVRHKGLLFRMYISAQYSGCGYGRLLMNEVIKRVLELGSIEQINLTVVATNYAAKRLYASLGFTVFAHEKRGIKDGDAYYDEEQMVLFLQTGPA
ncbi:GNAT family N-acetyltransferase [Spirosoma luteum]|uniref:GNAT family N-acetyltransferase n=1 Tax=Spirosoma luteum TaxID=431553 RepID=UPI00037ED070|nr:GNAT family N-acetyltransferase [Spirosoma luteum]